ncbi:MAG: alkaline phosphatase D family protein [Acidimicrobiales bacterium]
MAIVTRRNFVLGLAAAAVVPVPQCSPGSLPDPVPLPDDPFTLGVASGDPAPDGMVLWTRLAPDPLNGGGMPNAAVPVHWELALDPDFVDVIAEADAIADPALAHSVHARAIGLPADTWFWYRFTAAGWTSPVGRTRTAPRPNARPASLRFGVTTCQHYARGYYTAHQNLALEDLDLVTFVGDYIYEANASGPRTHGTPTATTLADYRNRYALYKSDPNLQAAHAAFPWMVTWDDHEVVNNYAGDADSSGTSTTAFLERRAQAYQAWYEHQPVMLPGGASPRFDIYRMLVWGKLARMAILDGRQFRTPYRCGSGGGALCEAMAGNDVTMLGTAQEQWLASNLAAAPATWHAIAQQTVMTPFAPSTVGSGVNLDQWDGYPAARSRMFDLLEHPAVTNPVVLTGDIHCAIALDMHRDGNVANPKVATELVAPAVSSTFAAGLEAGFEAGLNARPQTRHVNAHQRGYLTCEVTPDQWVARYRVVDSLVPSSGATTDATIVLDAEG